MKFFFALIYSVACWNICSGQNTTRQKTQQFITSHALDTFIVYSYECDGCFIPLDSCAWEITYHLFWLKNGSYYKKQFKTCTDTDTELLSTVNPLSYYLAHKTAIDTETILPPLYYELKKNKNGKIDTLTGISEASHSYFHTFIFSVNNNVKEKSADIYDLNFITFDNGAVNVNYERNMRTYWARLIKQIETAHSKPNEL